jgi:hypothetical protein
MTPTAREQWYKQPEKSALLKKTLETDIVKDAIAVLLEEAEPTEVSRSHPSGEKLTQLALDRQLDIGFHSFLSKLKALAEAPPEPMTPLEQHNEAVLRQYCEENGYEFPEKKEEQK